MTTDMIVELSSSPIPKQLRLTANDFIMEMGTKRTRLPCLRNIYLYAVSGTYLTFPREL